MVEKMVEQKSSLKHVKDALVKATQKGKWDTMKIILDEYPELVNADMEYHNNQTIMHILPLIHYDDAKAAEIIRKFVERYPVDVNIRSLGGLTPLHNASYQARIHRFSMLLELGADPNLKDERGRTAISLCGGAHQRLPFQRRMVKPRITQIKRILEKYNKNKEKLEKQKAKAVKLLCEKGEENWEQRNMSESEIKKKSLPLLRAFLVSVGLPKTGKKHEVVCRVKTYLEKVHLEKV